MEYFLEKVKESDKEILFRLLQYSLYEESANDKNEMNEEALFNYKSFDNYFNDIGREAFFIKEKTTNQLLGFAMINSYVQKYDSGHSIAEFLVIPKYRRNKIGKRVAFEIFNMYKGNWEVSPSIGSNLAYNFWNNVINEYTNQNNKFVDEVFMFNNE